MDKTFARDQILKNLNLKPTQDQFRFIKQFAEFLTERPERIFVLRGYAGTGKTTLVRSLAKALPALKMKSLLMAPTGRAAKVLSKYSRRRASTVHRVIYSLDTAGGAVLTFRLGRNKSKDTLFIVDESSMISGSTQAADQLFSGSNLLDDLIRYVDDGENCSILFIGDVAQLPPVNERVSPALSPKLLSDKYLKRAVMFEMKEVVRQEQESGILFNATQTRHRLLNQELLPQFNADFPDVKAISGVDFQDQLESCYSQGSIEDSIVICRSNKQANRYNQTIRNRVLYKEEELESGDLLMVVRNNYHWLDATSQAGFIANGDIVELLSISKMEEKWGFRFAHAEVRMLDYPDQDPISVVLNINALCSDSPAMTRDENDKLYEAIQKRHSDIKDKTIRRMKIKNDPYFQALQVKFSYAITCHKAQGGQWKNVFVDQGYLTPEMQGVDLMRWMYTAITRATDSLYLLNFDEQFISDGEESE
ncbi:AAA family ATPase [bacterium SCSIO 12741]|nr:AAA family ATPase [bacterium SCSIO 12741]